MKESVTYQAILEEGHAEGYAKGYAEGLEEGRIEQSRRSVLLLGTAQLGKPSRKTCRFLAGVNDRKVFGELILRIVKVGSWAELLPELD
jgi:hypothetical protein